MTRDCFSVGTSTVPSRYQSRQRATMQPDNKADAAIVQCLDAVISRATDELQHETVPHTSPGRTWLLLKKDDLTTVQSHIGSAREERAWAQHRVRHRRRRLPYSSTPPNFMTRADMLWQDLARQEDQVKGQNSLLKQVICCKRSAARSMSVDFEVHEFEALMELSPSKDNCHEPKRRCLTIQRLSEAEKGLCGLSLAHDSREQSTASQTFSCVPPANIVTPEDNLSMLAEPSDVDLCVHS